MKYLKIFVIFYLLSLNSYANDIRNLGLLLNYEIFLNYNNSEVFLKRWMREFGKRKNLNLEAIFYKNQKNLYKDFLSGKIDGAFFYFDFFLKHEKTIRKKTKLFWSLSFRKTNNFKYCLFTNKKSKIKNLRNLKGKSISLLKSAQLPYIWLNKQSLKINKKPIKKLLKKFIYEIKESTALLNTYFNKTDLAIVKKSVWNTFKELNPSITKQINLLVCSKNIFPIIGIFRKKLEQKYIDVFFSISKDREGNDDFFSLLLLDHFYELSNKEVTKMKTFFEEYHKLQKKYK